MKALKKNTHAFLAKLNRYKPLLRGSLLEYLLIAVIFALLTLVYTNLTSIDAIASQVFTMEPGDGTGGFMWYTFAQPGLNPILEHSTLVNYPYGENIGGPTFITYSGLWIPIKFLSIIFGTIAGINIFMILGYVLTALSMYWLVKRLTGSVAVSAFAAFAVSFAPYTIHKSLDHIAYTLTYVFIFIVASFIALWKKPTLLRSVLLGASIALAIYTDGYYILLGFILVVCLFLSGILYSLLTKDTLRIIAKKILYLVYAGVTVIVLLLPVLFVQISNGSEVSASLSERRSDISKEIHAYRSNVIDFIIPAQKNPFFENNENFHTIQNYKNQRSNPSESTNYLGFTLILLSAIGSVLILVMVFLKKFSSIAKYSKYDKNNVLIVASIAVVSIPILLSFMFSPDVTIAGYTFALPGKIFIDYDISLWRVMSRFFIPLHLILVLFAAISLWLILRVIETRLNNTKIGQIFRISIVAFLTLTLAFEYATTVNRPSYDFDNVNKGYYWLRDQSDIKTVVELPVVDPLDSKTAEYVTTQIIHKKNLLNSKENQKTSLNNTLGSASNYETIDWAYQRGADAAITHNTKCVEKKWGSIIYKDDGNLDDALCIYRITKPVTNDNVFVRYDNGVIQRPNADNQEIAVLDDNTVNLKFTDKSLTNISNSGYANFYAVLSSGVTPDYDGGYIFIKQNGREIFRSSILSESTVIDALLEVDKEYSINIMLPERRKINIGEYVLKNVTATQTKREDNV